MKKRLSLKLEGRGHRGHRVDMSGEGSFLGKRNSVNKGTKKDKKVHGKLGNACVSRGESCQEGRGKTRKTSVKGLPYMPCLGTLASFCWEIRSHSKILK